MQQQWNFTDNKLTKQLGPILLLTGVQIKYTTNISIC